jgi:hypothetical protein
VLGLAAAAFGLVLALCGDVAGSRAGLARVSAYGLSLLTGFAGVVAWLLLAKASLGTALTALFAYAAWWFAFLNLVQALESSLRARLLGEVRAAGGRMARATLEARYNDNGLLRLRLSRMQARGAVVERDGRLFVASSGLKAIAGLFRFLKLALLGRTSEFGAGP